MYNRREFLARSAGVMGGLTFVSAFPVLAACSGDSEPSGTASGTVGSVFNWVPDIEWSAWYLAEVKGFFGARGVTSELIHGGPNTPQVVQVVAAGDGDVGMSSGELEVNYHLYSYSLRHKMVVKTRVPEEMPVVPTVTGVWAGAGWHERESHDLFGVRFEGHPNLVPLLLYEGFEGFPGRKNFPFHEYDEW